jgi:hypothetical protein
MSSSLTVVKGGEEEWKRNLEVLFTQISDKLEVEAQLKHQLHTQVKEIDQIVRRTLASRVLFPVLLSSLYIPLFHPSLNVTLVIISFLSSYTCSCSSFRSLLILVLFVFGLPVHQFPVLQQTHGKVHEVGVLCEKARKLIEQAQPFYTSIRELIPIGFLHKYHDHWKFSLSQLVFASGLIVWFEEERLVTLQEASQLILGSSTTALSSTEEEVVMMTEEGTRTTTTGEEAILKIELEDYLTGLSYLPSELARFCVNRFPLLSSLFSLLSSPLLSSLFSSHLFSSSPFHLQLLHHSAIAKDYERPKRIATFVSELFAGFRLLNLKNDNLRKRYDSIKYDLKKIEEVVYDISIRGLSSTSTSSSSSAIPSAVPPVSSLQ